MLIRRRRLPGLLRAPVALAALLLASCSALPSIPVSDDADFVALNTRPWSGARAMLVDHDLRFGVFWYGFLAALTRECPAIFPEHEGWLGELSTLVEYGLGEAARRGIDMERQRLSGRASAESGLARLQALAESGPPPARVIDFLAERAGAPPPPQAQVPVRACSLLFDKHSLRELLRASAAPLADYFRRVQRWRPEIYGGVEGGPDILRRLTNI